MIEQNKLSCTLVPRSGGGSNVRIADDLRIKHIVKSSVDIFVCKC